MSEARRLKALEDEMIINNFGLNRPSTDPATAQFLALISRIKSDFDSWANQYYHLRAGGPADIASSPLYDLATMLHKGEWSRIVTGANSQLNEIGKLQDSRERQKGFDRVFAKVVLGTYLVPNMDYEQNLKKIHEEKYVEVMLGRKVPKSVVDSAIFGLNNDWMEWYKDASKLRKATDDFSKKVSEVIKEKLKELGIEFEHDVSISANNINYIGTGKVNILKLAEGKPKSEWWEADGNVGTHLKNASSYASILTEALQAFPRPIAVVLQKFIVEHPEIIFFGSRRGAWGTTPKDTDIKEIKNVDPKDKHMFLQLDGSTREESVITASHELTHMLITQILPEMQPVEWAVLSSLINQTDANGKISHDLIGANGGDILIGGELTSLYPNDARALMTAEPSGYTPKVATPYSTKYQNYAGLGAKRGSVVGLNPYGHGELLSTLTESMFNGSNQVFYGQDGVSPGDKVRIGYNADGTVKYFTIPESPIFNTGALPLGLAIALLMNQLAKDKLEVI